MIYNLPDELLRKIITELPPPSLHNATKINKRINSLKMTTLLMPDFINGTLSPDMISPTRTKFIELNHPEDWIPPTFPEIIYQYISKLDIMAAPQHRAISYKKTKYKNSRLIFKTLPQYRNIKNKIGTQLKIIHNPRVNALI